MRLGCFWVNLPISGTAFFLLFFFLDVHNPRTKVVEGLKAIDFLGSLCILGLTLMLLLGLDFGGVIFPWSSPKVICLIVFGVVMGGLFILSEKKVARYPLMPLGVFSHPSNIAVLVVTFCHGFVSSSPVLYCLLANMMSALHRSRILPPSLLSIRQTSLSHPLRNLYLTPYPV
jgi:MFS family permease